MALERTMAADVAGRVGETVRLCGWVEALGGGEGARSMVLRDPTGFARVVDERPPGPDVAPLPPRESAVEAVGEVRVGDGDAEGGTAFLALVDLPMVVAALDEPPIDEDSPLEKRLDYRFLDLRRPRSRLVFDVQTTTERAMRAWWAEHRFVELHTPKLRPTPNKSGSELFVVDYFDRKAYLAQSPQFYKQMAMASGMDRIFEIGPVFRANPLVTARHDTEFTSVDIEVSWISSHDDVMGFEERWLRHVIGVVADRHGDDIARVFGTEITVPEVPFPRLTMLEAQEIVAGAGHEVRDRKEGDLDPDGERLLAEHVAAETGHEFVFVTEYPEWIRPFYHMRCDHDPSLTRSFDLLWKGLEVTTGAQREHRYERLVAQARERNIPLRPIGFYLDCFRFGCPPHGGYGLGLTRFLMSLLGVPDVREVTFLHRGRERLVP
jgi:aspartyl-tRNA synthetase